MYIARFSVLFAALLSMVSCLNSISARAEPSILADPLIRSAIARQNWEPGGKNFGFLSIRGILDDASRAGNVNVSLVSSIRVGSFSLQSANIKGTYSYVMRFSNHPWEVHAPFDSSVSSSYEEKSDPKKDGSQTSYSLTWTGTQTHPADGYDGPQGGGYPLPAGARDNYSFAISGIATSIYFTGANQPQVAEKKGFFKGVWQRTLNFGENTVNNFVAGAETGAQGVVNVGYGVADVIRYGSYDHLLDGGADTVNGIANMFFSGVNGAVSAYVGPEVGELAEHSANYAVLKLFGPASIQLQYNVLEKFEGIQGWVSEHELATKLAEAGYNIFSSVPGVKALGSGVKALGSGAKVVGKSGKELVKSIKLVKSVEWFGNDVALGSAGVDATKIMRSVTDDASSFAGLASTGAESVNASKALHAKYAALEKAQQTAAKVVTLSDGRIRYYSEEVPARKNGPTRGASYVTEWNQSTGQVRSHMESYDHAGNVIRVHPKMIDGQTVTSPHYPPIAQELSQ